MTKTSEGILGKLSTLLSDQELDSLLSEILEYMPYSPSSRNNSISNLKSELDRSETSHKGGDVRYSSQYTRRFYFWVILLEFLHEIRAEDLGVSESSSLLKRIRQKRNNEVSSELLQLSDFYGSIEAKSNITASYYQMISDFYSKLSDSLFVYDYLDRHDFELAGEGETHDTLDEYSNIHKNIYDTIEEKLKQNPQIRYKRYLALPLRYNFQTVISDDELTKEIVRNLSAPLFKHIVNCLSFWESHKSEAFSDNGFYLIQFPTRTYHYIALNHGTSILFESYRYTANKPQICKPDVLQVIYNVQKDSPRNHIYLSEFQQLSRRNFSRFSLSNLKEAIDDLLEKPRTLESQNSTHNQLKSEDEKHKLLLKRNYLSSLM